MMIKTFILLWAFSGLNPSDSVKFVSAADVLNKAEELVGEEKLDEAIHLLHTVSENDTSYFEIQAELMSLYNAKEAYQKSIEIGTKLKDQYSKHRNNIYITLGNAYLDDGDPTKAIEIYTEGLRHFPYSHILLYNLGLGYRKLEQYDEAMACFKKSALINPYYGSNHIMLGYLSLLQGHRSKAMMSYLTYLAINPDRNNTLIFLENLANDALRHEGSIKAFSNNSLFADYDDLMRSKAANDSRFKREVDFNASIVKQTELLLSKLKFTEGTDDFWMNFYVPMFTRIIDENLHVAFIYFILQSSNNDHVKEWLSKHEDEKSKWIEIANAEFNKAREVQPAEVMGEQGAYQFWFYGNNSLSAIGNQVDDDTRFGPWAFYYQSSQLNALGKYNQKGQKIGTWKYYHENGRLSRTEQFDDNGNIAAPDEYYHDNGALSIIANYDQNELHGALEYYYSCGQLREKMPYQNGLKSGKGAYFFNTGEKEIDYNMKEGEFHGEYVTYFKNGQVERTYPYENGIPEGKFNSYYIDGSPNEAGKYENDELVGDWTGFHPNGNKSYEGSFVNDKRSGEWINFHKNGTISEKIFYNENGDIHGEYFSYYDNGNLNNILIYDEGKIIGCKFFDNNNEVIDEFGDESGDFEFVSHDPDGNLKIEGAMKGGKFNGPYTTYFKNGNVLQKSTMVDDNYHGDFEEYYQTGQLYIKCTYDNGKRNGYYQQYFKNGNIEAEGWYINDNMEQLWKTYYPDGSLSDESYYVAGNTNGWTYFYTADNKKDYALKMASDIITEIKQYDSLGNVYHHLKLPYGNGIFARVNVAGDTTFKSKMRCGEIYDTNYSYYNNEQIESIDPVNTYGENEKYESYDIEGNLLVKGQYKHGKKHGTWTSYSGGKVRSESYYELGLREKTGKTFHLNGKLESECEYYEGETHGTCKYYDQLGNLQLIKFYDKVEGVLAYIDVKSNDTIQFVEKDNFVIESYFPNGKLAMKQPYLYGLFHGEVLKYNNNGTLIEGINYQYGELDGNWRSFYANGKTFVEVTYSNGLKHGTETEYFDNGKIRRQTPYENDKIHGEERIYNKNGSIKIKTYYWNNEVY